MSPEVKKAIIDQFTIGADGNRELAELLFKQARKNGNFDQGVELGFTAGYAAGLAAAAGISGAASGVSK